MWLRYFDGASEADDKAGCSDNAGFSDSEAVIQLVVGHPFRSSSAISASASPPPPAVSVGADVTPSPTEK